ncbi:MAG: 3-dehydroquinate dehydratase [Bacilli bacterium]|nr:3-dehydroquinate dehydratase [Bacilli bacterium]
MQILIINGPNLNFLGRREPHIYGSDTLESIQQRLLDEWTPAGVNLDFFQSNHEGALVDRIQEAWGKADGIVINPGAYTHTSVALRDVFASVEIPTIEVHISNIHKRESFRHTSYCAPVVLGQIVGLGINGYSLAVRALIEYLQNQKQERG